MGSKKRFGQTLLGFGVLALLTAAHASAEANPCAAASKKLFDAVVMVRSDSQAGTGFLLEDGSVVTNSHVVEGVCDKVICRNLQILTANKLGRLAGTVIRTGVVRAESNARLLDLAILRPQLPIPDAQTRGLKFGKPILHGETICTMGFPHAEELTLTSGKVQHSDRLRVTTTARGLHGVSGSPIVNSAGELVAVVNESSTLAGGWKGLLFSVPFELSGVKESCSRGFKEKSALKCYCFQARVMNEYFTQRVGAWTKSDTPRFVDTAWEANQMEAFAEDLKRARVKIGSLAPLDSYAGEPFLLVNTLIEKYPDLESELDLEAEKLFLTYTIGMDPLLTSWKARLLSKRVAQMPRSEAHKSALNALLFGDK